MFIELDSKFLSEISTDSERVPTLYYSKNWFIKKFFWLRLRLIYKMIKKRGTYENCLDFCGGGGVFLPTLCSCFKSVTFADLEDIEAKKVISFFKLTNVNLVKGDIANAKFKPNCFDVIIAADVLEHFKNLSVPTNILKECLSKKGVLYTSLPTESYLYVFLRRLFGIEKPKDHYHNGRFIEQHLQSLGFVRAKRRYVPFCYFPIFSLFVIGEWKLK